MKNKPKPRPGAGNKNAQKGAVPRVPLFVRLDPSTVERIKFLAAQRGLSQSDTVALALSLLK